MNVHVYIDGFNLYYRALKRRREMRWLDVECLCNNLLQVDDEIGRINYYTALVDDRIDPGADIRQLAYLRALRTLPRLSIHFGNFMTKENWSKIKTPPEFKPEGNLEGPPWPDVVRTIRSEEKGSDVNLAAHLVRDAFQRKFELAVVISNDTDLCEAIRIVKEDAGLPVLILCPAKRASPALQEKASATRYIRASHLQAAQFPDEITTGQGTTIHRPPSWSASAD